MSAITYSGFYNITCKVCTVISNAIVGAFVALIAMGETAGTARAAAELTRQGYHKEAKALMMELKKMRGH